MPCELSCWESTNSSDWPGRTTGGPAALARQAEVAVAVGEAGDVDRSGRERRRPRAGAGPGRSVALPPWLSFSGRWPWVGLPGQSTRCLERVRARAGVGHVGDHDPHRLVPGGALGVVGGGDLERVALAQLDLPVGRVAVIATSQDTAPAGSKYFASERNRCAVSPFTDGWLRAQRLRAAALALRAQFALAALAPSRVSQRSVCRPPGCRWPAVATSTPSRSTTHSFLRAPLP